MPQPPPISFPPTALLEPATIADVTALVHETRLRDPGGQSPSLRSALAAEQVVKSVLAGDPAAAKVSLDSALLLAGDAPDLRLLFLAFQFLFRTGDLDRAETVTRQRLTLARPGSPAAARAWSNLGLILQQRGDLDAAEPCLRRAIQIDRELNDLRSLARDLGNLGLVPESRRDWSAAEDLFRQALAIAQDIDEQPLVASMLANLGDIALNRSQPQAARDLWSQSLAIFDRLGITKWRAVLVQKLSTPPEGTPGAR